MTTYTEEYLPYCRSESQIAALKAVVQHGSIRKAAEAIGMNKRNLEKTLARIRLEAARYGYSPAHDMTHPCPPTHILKGTSTLYDGNGLLRQQWVKTDRVTESLEQTIRAIAEGLMSEVPKVAPVKAPAKALNADIHNVYVITDYHLGMYSWGEETGADWDLDIAERTILDWFRHAIAQAPAAESATFAQLGDFLHWDGLEALTPASKHVLDADTRFQKVVRTAIRVIRQIVAMLLAKHQRVTLVMADANHDPAGGAWLREMLAVMYEDEPRITVDNSADTYYCQEFGKTALFFHHGHKRGPKDLPSVLVAKFREVYGRTKHHYAHTGHLHHDVVRECNLMKTEQHRTLAAQDAYASRAGYMSGRDAKVIVYHKDHGEVSRITVSYDMVKAS